MTTVDVDPALRPAGWDEFIGQEPLKRVLATYIKAAVEHERVLEHILLTGPPGMGKTSLAQIIADQLGDELLVFSRPPTRRDLHRKLTDFRSGVVLIDEVHEWPKSMQEELLTVTEEQVLETPRGRVPLPMLTVILATTERERILRPLVTRMMVAPSFTPYTDAEMALIVDGMGAKAGLDLDWEVAAALGRAAGGVPRQARKMVLAARAIEQVHDRPATVAEILTFVEAEPDGLTGEHLAYLGYLVDLGGEAGVEVLANRMRLHPADVKELERLLLDRKLLTLGRSGRQLTVSGQRRAEGELDVLPIPRRQRRRRLDPEDTAWQA